MTLYAAYGSLLKMDDGGGVTFTTLAQVKDISGPNGVVDIQDATNQSSPGGFEEIVPTIRRSGEVQFAIVYDPNDATHDGLTGLEYVWANVLKRNFKIVLPVSPTKTWAFAGYVTTFNQKAPVAGLLEADCVIRVTGQPTIS